MNALFPVFVEVMLKSCLILALAFAVTAIWRGASAATRQMVWILALAAILVLPFTKLASPIWTLRPPVDAVAIALPPVSLTGTKQLAAPTTKVVMARLPQESRRLPSWPVLLLWGWLAGAGALVSYRIVSSWRVRCLHRQSRPLTDERTLTLARAIAAESGVLRFELRCSRDCPAPLTWGIWRPVLLLPEATLRWPELLLRATLNHEFAHISRRDCLARLLAHLACAFYWMNPLVWLATRKMRLAQEQACDDRVLRSGAPATDYADLLLQIARSLSGQPHAARHALGMAHQSNLATRVQAIMDNGINRAPMGRAAAAIGLLIAVTLMATSALAQMDGKPRKSETDTPQTEAKSPVSQKRTNELQKIYGGPFVDLSPASSANAIQYILSLMREFSIMGSSGIADENALNIVYEELAPYILPLKKGNSSDQKAFEAGQAVFDAMKYAGIHFVPSNASAWSDARYNQILRLPPTGFPAGQDNAPRAVAMGIGAAVMDYFELVDPLTLGTANAESVQSINAALSRLEAAEKIDVVNPIFTPYDKAPQIKTIYLEAYRKGYRTVLASVFFSSGRFPNFGDKKASQDGWLDGIKAAKEDHPDKAASKVVVPYGTYLLYLYDGHLTNRSTTSTGGQNNE